MGKHWLFTTLLTALLIGCGTQVETIDCEKNPDSPQCTPIVQQDGIPPRLYVDPPFGLSFSCLTIGCDEEKIVTLENRGGSTLAIARLEIIAESGPDKELRDAIGENIVVIARRKAILADLLKLLAETDPSQPAAAAATAAPPLTADGSTADAGVYL